MNGRSWRLVFATVAATVLMLVGIESAPVFASNSVHPAEIREVAVPGTHPLDASAVDLAKDGYGEQEYYASGTANRYRIKNPTATATLVDGGHTYKRESWFGGHWTPSTSMESC